MAKKEDSFELDLTKIFSKLKPAYLILFLILCFGLYLRLYQINYPIVGYHNWKVAHYITEARNFAEEGFFKYGFFVPMRDTTESIAEPSDGEHNDTFPTEPILVGLLFKIFGQSLIGARLLEVILSLAAVLLFYLLIKELFEREDLALVSAFLAAINPMYVFFTHNIDVINSGLFLMLFGAYYYIRWIKHQFEKHKFSYLYLGVFFSMLGAITKYTFAVILIPMLLVFPFKKILKSPKKYFVPLAIAGIILAGFPLWFGYSEIYVKKYVFGKELTQNMLDSYEMTKLIDFSIIWSSDFWTIMKSYIADNFTLLGITFSFMGMAFFSYLYFTKNKEKLGYRFMFAYLVSIFIFLFVMGYKLSGHNYHQFPVAPLIIFMMAYFMIVISGNIASIITKKEELSRLVKLVIIGLLIIMPPGIGLYSQSVESKNRMYDTQFFGLDIAGDYIKQHKDPSDRAVHSSGQSYGFLWYADMRGYKMPPNVDYFKKAETEYNVSWVFMYSWGIPVYFQNTEVMNHIRENYRLVQFAFIQGEQQQQVTPLFFLFRRGGSFNDSQFNNLLSEKPIVPYVYNVSSEKIEVRYINIE